MSLELTLCAHVRDDVGVFAGLSVWSFGLVTLRRAQRVEQARFLAAVITASSSLAMGGVVIILGFA